MLLVCKDSYLCSRTLLKHNIQTSVHTIITNGSSINMVLTRTSTRDVSTVTAGTGSDAAGVGALLSCHKLTSLKSSVIIYDLSNGTSTKCHLLSQVVIIRYTYRD